MSQMKDRVGDFKTCWDRVFKMTVNLQQTDSIAVIHACSPTSSAEDEKLEQLYGIEWAVVDSDSKYKIITRDFNATIGAKTKGEDFKNNNKTWQHLKGGREWEMKRGNV